MLSTVVVSQRMHGFHWPAYESVIQMGNRPAAISWLRMEVCMTRMLSRVSVVCSTFLSLMFLGPLESGAINVTSCGYLTQANSTYVLQNDVYSDGSCFFITAGNVTLDLNGHVVTYDNATPVSVTNGDFEAGSGWDLSAAPNAAIAAGSYVKPVSVYSGSQSVRIAVPNADQAIRSTSPVQLQPNTTYTLSAMVYNQVSDPATVYVELAGTSTRAGKTGKTWRGFQYVYKEFTTSSIPAPVTIVAGITGAATGGYGFVYIDDIRIQRTRVAGVVVGPATWQAQNIIADAFQFGNANYATIRNGTIQQGRSKADFSDAVTVMENSGEGWKLQGLTIRADGANCRAIRSRNAVNAEIASNHIYNPQWAIVSRDAFDGAAVRIDWPGYGSRIQGNTVHEGVQTAFYLQQKAGQPQNEVTDNIVELQTRYTNDFAIVAGCARVGGNTINCADGDNSCRGITLGGTGTLVVNNTVNVRELPRNQEYNGCMVGGAYGMQMEANTTGLNVYGNIVTAYAGECEAYAFRANPYAEGGTGSYNNAVHENTFVALKSGAARAATIKYSKLIGTDVSVYNNILRTNHRWIFVDGGGPVTDPSFVSNRWETTGTVSTPFSPFEVYTWADSHFNGTFNDNAYGPGDQARFESELFRLANGNPDPLSSFTVSSSPVSPTPPTTPTGLSLAK
jgi:hypothetical protein